MLLGDLHAYIRLPEGFPITPLDFIYKHREKRNAGFVLRHFDDRSLKEIDALIDNCEKVVVSIKPDDVNNPATKKKKKEKNLAVATAKDNANDLKELNNVIE